MPLSTGKYAVISGDGSGINKVGDTDITFEVKCPTCILGKSDRCVLQISS